MMDVKGTTDAVVDRETGSVVIQVANKKIARLVQLGVGVEKAQRLKAARRKMQRQSRRANRRSK